MTVRIPVKEVEQGTQGTAHRFQRCSQAEVNRIMYEMLHQWATNPSATITVGTGNFGNISDTRLEVGAAGSDSTDFDTESETADVSTETVNYNKLVGSFNGNNPITITRGSDPGGSSIEAVTKGSNGGFPMFMTFSNSNHNVVLQEFTLQDMIDTFWIPAVDKLIVGIDTQTNNAGTYVVGSSTSSTGATLSNRTKISTTPIFTDTRATASDYTAAGLPEAADQQDVVNYYHLYRWDAITSASTLNTAAGAHLPHLIVAADDSTNPTTFERIRHTDLKAQLEAVARYACLNESGQRIQYTINTDQTGYNWRDTIYDTRLDGSTYLTNLVGDDYRSQEVPSGSAATINTYKFLIRKA